MDIVWPAEGIPVGARTKNGYASVPHSVGSTARARGPGITVTTTFQRILHIEDSETDAFIVRRGLRDVPGLAIEWVTTGSEGLEKARRESYDLILLDYALPDMTGLEVLVRLTQRQPDAPVVLVSGFGSEYVAARGIHLGALGYVNKDTPEFKEDLKAILQKLFEAGVERRRSREIEELVKQQPTIRKQVEGVLTDLRKAIPDARGSFVASFDGLPIAVSKRGDEKEVDVLSAMACASVLKNLDVLGSAFELKDHKGGIVHYSEGSLMFHKVESVGSLVVILDRQASWRDDGKEMEQALKEIEEVILKT